MYGSSWEETAAGRRGHGFVAVLLLLRQAAWASFCLVPWGGRSLVLAYWIPALQEEQQRLQLLSQSRAGGLTQSLGMSLETHSPLPISLERRCLTHCAISTINFYSSHLWSLGERSQPPRVPELRPLGSPLLQFWHLHSQLFGVAF